MRAVLKLQAAIRGHAARSRAHKVMLAHLAADRARWGQCVFLRDAFHDLVEYFHLARFLPGHVTKYERVQPHDEDDEQNKLYGMAKMSRLSTDLANERTLLAWVPMPRRLGTPIP